MKKEICVTVTLPVTFRMEIDDSNEIECIKNSILDMADNYFESSGIDPIISDCYDATTDEPLTDLID